MYLVKLICNWKRHSTLSMTSLSPREYSTWLLDDSTITFREKGASQWTTGTVVDDRIYKYPTARGINPGEFQHLTAVQVNADTNYVSIMFKIGPDGLNTGDMSYEVLTDKMN